jgi:predicted metal-dependent peptidase
MKTQTTVERRLQKARTALLLDHPFFGSLLFRLKGRESRSIKTMATDGISLFYNPDFVDTLNAATLCGVLAHEVLHPGLQHHVRRSGRDPKRWNEACDYAINPILLDAGLHLPEGVLVDDRFSEMSAEQIYNQLQTEAEQEPGGPDDTQETGGDGAASCHASQGDSGKLSAPETEGGIGQVLDAPAADEDTPTVEEQVREWSVAVNQAVTLAKQAGKVPAGMERTLDGAGTDFTCPEWCGKGWARLRSLSIAPAL